MDLENYKVKKVKSSAQLINKYLLSQEYVPGSCCGNKDMKKHNSCSGVLGLGVGVGESSISHTAPGRVLG